MRNIVPLVLVLVILISGLNAQRIIGCGGGGDPTPTPMATPTPTPTPCPGSTTAGPINTSYGYYQWQVDQLGATTTFDSETGFSTPPGLVQIPINLACPLTVHEVHGNVSFGVFQSGTCGTGSMIAQILDQSGNAIAVANIIQFGISSANVSIKGTFATPLSVTSMTMQFYDGQCGSQVASWSLSLS